MLVPPERSSAVLAKVSSKSCLSAVVDARLVDSRRGYNLIIVYYANKGAWYAYKTLTQIHKDKNILDNICFKICVSFAWSKIFSPVT